MDLYIEEHIYQVRIYDTDRRKIDDSMNDPEKDATSEIWEWCEETFGEWHGRWYHEYLEVEDADVYCFKNDEDRNWFVLRWS